MNKFAPVAAVVAVLFSFSLFTSSCTKTADATNLSLEQGALSRWNINRIQLKLYYNGNFYKDTIIPQTPQPENFVQLDASGAFQYRFNTASIDAGSYQFKGADSVIATTSTKTYRWKMLTLIDVLFTVMSTSTNDPAFPGATVETYYTLVK